MVGELLAVGEESRDHGDQFANIVGVRNPTTAIGLSRTSRFELHYGVPVVWITRRVGRSRGVGIAVREVA